MTVTGGVDVKDGEGGDRGEGLGDRLGDGGGLGEEEELGGAVTPALNGSMMVSAWVPPPVALNSAVPVYCTPPALTA